MTHTHRAMIVDNWNKIQKQKHTKKKEREGGRELNSHIKELINKVHSLGNLRVYAMDEEGNTVYIFPF